MNLKPKSPFMILLVLLALSSQVSSNLRTCKTQLLRSFSLHSRITPNRLNSVCPEISLNCCTTHDQMRMHKMWKTHANPHISAHHTRFRENFKKLRAFLVFKDRLKVDNMFHIWTKFAKPQPSPEMVRHLDDLIQEFHKIDGPLLKKELIPFIQDLYRLQREVKKLRRGFLCALCEWNNHTFFNIASSTVTYHGRFCLKIVEKFIQTLSKKYNEYVKLMLLVDEIVYIVSDYRIMENPYHRAIFRRNINIISECEKNTEIIKNCAELCRSFNLNKFSPIFDGEDGIFLGYVNRFNDVLDGLIGDKKDFLDLFAQKRQKWKKDQLEKFKEHHSVLSKKIIKDPTRTEIKRNKFNLHFRSQATKEFIEVKHHLNSLQIETLDDQIDAINLYRLSDTPADITNFMIIFEAFAGLDLYRDSKKVNLGLRPEQILSLIHHKHNDANTLSEVIDEKVSKMLMDLQLSDMALFLSEQRLHFKRVGRVNPGLALNKGLKAKETADRKKAEEAAKKAKLKANKQAYLPQIIVTLMLYLLF